MYDVYFTPDTWDNIETTEDLPIHHEKLMEQIIQQIKIDMYKDRYKAYGAPIRLIFMSIFKKGNRNEEK